jgi:hypothetical protein
MGARHRKERSIMKKKIFKKLSLNRETITRMERVVGGSNDWGCQSDGCGVTPIYACMSTIPGICLDNTHG